MRVFLGIGNVVTNLVMDEALDYILLVSAHDYAADLCVIWFGKEILRLCWIPAVFERNKVVLLIAGRVVGMRHAPGGIDFSRGWVDELRPCLMDSIPVFRELFHFQLGRVFGWRPDLLRAPLAVADVALDVLLRDLWIRCTRSHRRVRVDFRRTDTDGWRPSTMRQEDAG